MGGWRTGGACSTRRRRSFWLLCVPLGVRARAQAGRAAVVGGGMAVSVAVGAAGGARFRLCFLSVFGLPTCRAWGSVGDGGRLGGDGPQAPTGRDGLSAHGKQQRKIVPRQPRQRPVATATPRPPVHRRVGGWGKPNAAPSRACAGHAPGSEEGGQCVKKRKIEKEKE